MHSFTGSADDVQRFIDLGFYIGVNGWLVVRVHLYICSIGYQKVTDCIPVRSWTWTGLPGQRPSAGRQDFWSTTPAVIVEVGIGCPIYTTVHCRRPSICCRRGTTMEQFASRSDVIEFPANLQDQTKISFILGVVPLASKLL